MFPFTQTGALWPPSGTCTGERVNPGTSTTGLFDFEFAGATNWSHKAWGAAGSATAQPPWSASAGYLEHAEAAAANGAYFFDWTDFNAAQATGVETEWTEQIGTTASFVTNTTPPDLTDWIDFNVPDAAANPGVYTYIRTVNRNSTPAISRFLFKSPAALSIRQLFNIDASSVSPNQQPCMIPLNTWYKRSMYLKLADPGEMNMAINGRVVARCTGNLATALLANQGFHWQLPNAPSPTGLVLRVCGPFNAAAPTLTRASNYAGLKSYRNMVKNFPMAMTSPLTGVGSAATGESWAPSF